MTQTIMKNSQEERFSRLTSAILSGAAFIVLLPFITSIFSLLMYFVYSATEYPTKAPYIAFLVRGALAVVVDLVIARLIYSRIRWRKPSEERGPVISLTPGDWFMAILNFTVMLIVLSILVPSLLLRFGTHPIFLLTIVRFQYSILPLLSAANAFTYLRRRIRKRVATENERRIVAGLCRWCEYNLTGNVSGVCPECGEAR